MANSAYSKPGDVEERLMREIVEPFIKASNNIEVTAGVVFLISIPFWFVFFGAMTDFNWFGRILATGALVFVVMICIGLVIGSIENYILQPYYIKKFNELFPDGTESNFLALGYLFRYETEGTMIKNFKTKLGIGENPVITEAIERDDVSMLQTETDDYTSSGLVDLS
ncbi:MAG TPA: hypothetical protein VGB30_06985 [bacterium]|jgi:hypothetical protein